MSRTVPLLENVGRAMRRLHDVQSRLGTRLASRRGRISVLAVAMVGAAALVAGVLPLVGGAADGRGQLESGASPATVSPGDTVPIWGPSQFNGSSGQGQTYVEQFTTTVNPARIYVLHLVNGAPRGGSPLRHWTRSAECACCERRGSILFCTAMTTVAVWIRCKWAAG